MYILNQVYPLKSDNCVPDENVFQTSSLESVLCQNCNHALEKTLYIDTICLMEFPDPYQGNSIWNEVERLPNNPHRELLQELNECLHCPMQTTAAKSKHY